jgi:hypothetical protein
MALLANDYMAELSCQRANEIVQSYADVLAEGGYGRIPNASLLPYEKETIYAAIDRFVECLTEQNGGREVLSTPELENKINTLRSAQVYLSEFQDIDPDDQHAIAVLNSCPDLVKPVPVDESDWFEFLAWQNKISLKYSRRRRMVEVGG